MAVHRTRQEKIQIQQRREQEKFTWKEEPASAPVTHVSRTPSKKAASLEKEHHWLRNDLLQTLFSVLVVLLLLAYFYWRSQ